VSDISRVTGLHLATTSRIVAQMVDLGLLERLPDRRVRVGMRLWELALRASPNRTLRDAALPVMEVLHATVQHDTQLVVLDGTDVVFVERLRAPGAAINFSRVAGRLPAHVSSSGLVLLANAPPNVLDQMLARPLEAMTEHTVTDPGDLRRLVTHVRAQKFAICRGFVHPDACGLAAPVRDHRDRVVAALSVIVPNDVHARDHLPGLLAAARAVSGSLAATRPRNDSH
jgi:DNA-binding IclR family transcriptional regulator